MTMPLQLSPSLKKAFQRSEHPYLMWDELQNTGEAVEDILGARVRGMISKAAELIQEQSIIHFIGCGTSHFSSIAATYVLHQFTEKLGLAHEAHEFVSYPPPLSSSDACIAVSHSGSTPAVTEGAVLSKQNNLACLAVTDNIESSLVNQVDVAIMGSHGVEPPLPKTRSFVTTLLRQYLLVLELAELAGQKTEPFLHQLATLPQRIDEMLGSNQAYTKNMAAELKEARRIVVIGGGPQYPIALEASLKITETAAAVSEAWEVEEAGHGTWASSDASDLAIVLGAQGPSFEKAINAGRALAGIGMDVWLISDDDQIADWATYQTNLGQGLSEWVVPILTILPLYQFSYWLALEKGLNPDIMRLDNEDYLWARTMMRYPEQLEESK